MVPQVVVLYISCNLGVSEQDGISPNAFPISYWGGTIFPGDEQDIAAARTGEMDSEVLSMQAIKSLNPGGVAWEPATSGDGRRVTSSCRC